MNPSTVKRLAFIKYVFQMGYSQSYLPEPTNAVSILLFHDSIELFLQLACEHLDISTPSHIDFISYWPLISQHLENATLPQGESMKRLNKSRVALKHHGTLPSKLDIESFRDSALSFFNDSSQKIFTLEFANISIIDFVNEESTRQYLHEALGMLSEGNIETAVEKVAFAFHFLMTNYESRKRSLYHRSPFDISEDFHFLSRHHLRLGYEYNSVAASRDFQNKLGDFVDKVIESFESIQEAFRILAMDIDYPKYSRFLLITPHVYITADDKIHAQAMSRSITSINKADIQFCIDFVVETALKLQESDYPFKA